MVLRLKEIRQLRKISQKTVADAIGCSVATYSRYESGKRQPSLEVLVTLSYFYDVTIDYMLGKDKIEEGTLSDYERELISATRQAPLSVCEDVLDFVKMKNSKTASK